jgi:diguanylate cyclase (GGDEF)-like protein
MLRTGYAKHMLMQIILAFAMMIVTTLAVGIEPAKMLKDLVHRKWSLDDGLPQSTVRAMAQTPDGYLWLANHQGLIRFDGRRFLVFNESNTPALVGSGISALQSARNGSLWIGLRDGGVVNLAGDKFTPLTVTGELPAGNVTAILEGGDGRLWISTSGGGVGMVQNNRGTVFNTDSGLPNNNVLTLQSTKDGRVYAGTGRGLVVFREGKIADGALPADFMRNTISALHVDSRERLWVGVTNSGLYMRDLSLQTDDLMAGWTQYDQNIGMPSQITRVLVDRDDNVWLGSIEGLLRIRGTRIEKMTAEMGLSSNYVRDLFEDVEANIWVGTEGGLDRIRDGRVTMWNQQRGLKAEFTRTVLEDKQGQIWVGTSDGLYRFSSMGEQVRRFDRQHGLVSTAVLSMAESANGTLWIGTNSGGLHIMKDERLYDIGSRLEIGSTPIRALLPLSDKGILVGTGDGLYHVTLPTSEFMPAQVTPTMMVRIGASNGLGSDQIHSLTMSTVQALANGEAVWVGTRDGLYLWQSQSQKASKYTGISNTVFAVTEVENLILAATSRGLIISQRIVAEAGTNGSTPTTVLMGKKNGLSGNAYFRILDHDRHIWLCSVNGMLRIEKADIQKAISNSNYPLAPLRLDKGDGMSTTQCNGGTQPSGTVTRDGRIMFATARGIAVHSPAQKIRLNQRPPPIHITAIHVDNVAQPVSTTLDLAATTRRVEFKFVGLSYADADRVRYRYRMEGFDPDWINAEHQTEATYTNLPAGNYRFQVIAANEDDVWNEVGAVVELVQRAPFYKQTNFQIAIAATLLLLLGLAYWWRVRALRGYALRLKTQVVARTLDIEAQKAELQQANSEKTALVDQLREQSEANERLSRQDALTEIANRRALDRALESEWLRISRSDAPLALIMLDVDYFKQVNDRYSHATGDIVLRKIAELILVDRRKIDTVARYGGEEFVILLPETPLGAAAQVAERIRQRISEYDWSLVAQDLHITTSCGVAEASELPVGSSAERLIMLADTKLYQAKARGRNQVVV